ncbi:MAG: DUF3078 domain-containing protein [Paludibacteraceae bacterium]|nr:DUF3078 domain-containing protein [Paludibacteraceae bacterium]
MKKILTLALALITLVPALKAQDENKATVDEAIKATTDAKSDLTKVAVDENKYWKLSGVVSMNASATGLWNWAAGGNNNATGIAGAILTLNYKKNRLAWSTILDTEYGLSYIEDTYYEWQKASDKLNLTTKLGYELAPKWYLTALASFRTQYTSGYTYATDHRDYISDWLAPSYTDVSIGIDWIPNDIVSLYLSPIAGRITTAVTDSAALRSSYLGADYGTIDPITNRWINEDDYKFEFGATFKAQAQYEPVKNLKLISTLSLFTPYTENFGNIDVDWDMAISYQFLKVLNVKLGTTLKYYDSVLIADKNGNNPHQRVQFKAVLGLGIGYSF